MSTLITTTCAFAGLATATMNDLGHLEGQTVSILANGVVLDQQTINSGSLSLGSSYSVVHVGLPFYSDIETLNVDVRLKDDSSIQGQRAKISNVIYRLRESRGGYVGPDSDNLYNAFSIDAMNQSSGQNIDDTDLFTGDIRQPLGGEYSDGGRVFYRQVDPLPITIGAIMPEVDIGGRSR